MHHQKTKEDDPLNDLGLYYEFELQDPLKCLKCCERCQNRIQSIENELLEVRTLYDKLQPVQSKRKRCVETNLSTKYLKTVHFPVNHRFEYSDSVESIDDDSS